MSRLTKGLIVLLLSLKKEFELGFFFLIAFTFSHNITCHLKLLFLKFKAFACFRYSFIMGTAVLLWFTLEKGASEVAKDHHNCVTTDRVAGNHPHCSPGWVGGEGIRVSISVHLCLNHYAFVVLEESFDEDRVKWVWLVGNSSIAL